MNRILLLAMINAFLLFSCNNSNSEDAGYAANTTEFRSEKVNNKWTLDRATAEELKGMKNTIENFTLLNKKKFENLKAYQEYGALLRNHIERVNTFCGLDAESKNVLCKNLDKFKTNIEILEGNNMEQSHKAMEQLNTLFAQIDSTYNYSN